MDWRKSNHEFVDTILEINLALRHAYRFSRNLSEKYLK